jgi:hypothetical protein
MERQARRSEEVESVKVGPLRPIRFEANCEAPAEVV